jgi:PAS domain S-box-containing protein
MTEPMEPTNLADEMSQLFNLSLQMLCIAGTDGFFKRVNPAFGQTLGYSRDELLSRPFLDLVHPEDREKTLSEVSKLAAGLPTIHFENRYRRKDGVYRWFSWSAAPVKERGLIYATALDVTERKRAEILFRQVLESTPDAMIIVNSEGKIVLVNKLAEQAFGYEREEMINQDMELLIPHRFHQRHRQYFAGYRASPRVRPMGADIEIWSLRKNGSEFPAEISLSPLETDEGLLVLCAHRDVTERKRMEQTLREKEAQLLAAQKIQERLLPDASPAVPGFDIYGVCYPAEFAAGDHFDYLPMQDDRIGIVVGDVVGHGIGPALVMASTHAHLRSLAEICTEPDEILLRLNRNLFKETEPNIFVTLLFACLDPRSRTLRYASAGHPPGYVLDGQGKVKATLPSTSLPLGIQLETQYHISDPIALTRGDVTLLFTDGLIEASSPSDKPFGVKRVIDVVRRHIDQTARQITESLYQALMEYSGGHKPVDDITLVVVKTEQDG